MRGVIRRAVADKLSGKRPSPLLIARWTVLGLEQENWR
jgi:hypothetical protein